MRELTIEEKRKAIEAHCNAQDDCDACPYTRNQFCEEFALGIGKASDTTIEAWWKLFFGKGDDEPTTNDVVNHPKHYCREGAMESIDEMLLIFGAEAVKGFCLCNAWKYRYRASAKNGEEDLRKSDWYIAKYKELCER